VPDLRPGGRRVVELLDRHDALEADRARLAVIGLVVVLVVGSHLDRATERRLLVRSVDEHHPVLDQGHRLGFTSEVRIAQLDGEPAGGLDAGIGLERHRVGGSSFEITVCDCSRRNCWT
jgi:hypothetical protein